MKKLLFIILVCFVSVSFGQNAFNEINTSRYARVVGLGNAFTGLADDIEAVYFNSAGLANLEYYSVSYSKGSGFAFVLDDITSDDFAILLPTFSQLGKFALSVDRQYYNGIIDGGFSLFRLHFARKILKNFSIGTSLNYYYFSTNSYSTVTHPGGNDEELSGKAFDLSLSALYSLPVASFGGISNVTRFGFQMQNLLDTDLNFSNDLESSPKHQTLRIGISSSFIPEMKKIANLTPIKLIGIFDAVFYGGGYKFDRWQPNLGIEVKLFDIISLRYGRENEKVITETYSYSPQHPVKRYGVGLSIPFDKFISNYKKMELSLDYSYSDWDKLDETKPMLYFYPDNFPVQSTFSIKFAFNL